ncbi:phosphopantetheine-binding protein [Rhizobium sp. L1K21]|uniref:phosphopantetheine-binding protein n=1 Tax=Rhizobium sp. L1K21 TaxID=2954933 RepID=UPI00209298F7|nr:phosphopantetheine-binding protein [Rhizobium sp. L1K21]MCO6184797.1 phosphopantetheine-binding protein [Rhizobium sp. L1K21]
MSNSAERITAAVTEMLAAKNDHAPINPQESLFETGRLDSLAATELIVLLESEFGVDVSSPDFDISQLDNLSSLQRLVA